MQPSQFASQYNLTQSSQGGKVSPQSIIENFIKKDQLISQSSGAGVEEDIRFVRAYYATLSVEQRRDKLFKAVWSKDDSGSQFCLFITAWTNLLAYSEERHREIHRLAAIKAILTAYESKPVTVLNFVPVYNMLCSELPKLSHDGISQLLELTKERVKSPDDFLWRWKDCLHVLLCHYSKIARTEDVATLVQCLLATAQNKEIFRYVVSIAKDLRMTLVVEQFVSQILEIAANEIRFRLEISWKGICALEYLDPAASQKLLLSINSLWRSKDGFPAELLTLAPPLCRVVENCPAVGKIVTTLFKQDPLSFLTRPVGLLSILSICNNKRYQTSAVQEVKKALNKLWKFAEEAEQFGWTEETGFKEIADMARRQFDQCVTFFKENGFSSTGKDLWPQLGQPLILIGYALIECHSSKTVTIADGRVVDDGSIWLFAREILTTTLLANTAAIPTQLESIVNAIASTANNGAALVLIDVLVAIVKKCAVEVLNNSKLLDSLFEYICKMRREVGISLIRCLLPVINQRAKLRETLFKNLKNEMLNEASVGSAIPILILLLRSVSRKKCLKQEVSQSMSQSFASFSTQSLDVMGMKPTVDDAVALEIIGILQRCLTQPASTKVLLYEGIAEAASRCPSLIGPCLDLLTKHAETVPSWRPADMFTVPKQGRAAPQLNEPLPQLTQTIQCLCHESMGAPVTESQVNDEIVQTATKILDGWIVKAVSEDVHDLGLNKFHDWSTSHFAFAQMMLYQYDVVLEHVWYRYDAFKSDADRDNLIGLLRRRKELDDCLTEKVAKKKENKGGAADVEWIHKETFTCAQVLATVLDHLVPRESSSTEIAEIRLELLEWAVEQAVRLSRELSRASQTLRSNLASPSHLTTIAGHLMNLYIGSDCAQWMHDINCDTALKTKAVEAYANICRLLCTKYKKEPAKIANIWKKAGSTCTQGTQTDDAATCIVRHVHRLMFTFYPALLSLDIDEDKKTLNFEKQAKFLVQASTALLTPIIDSRVANYAFKFLVNMIASNCFVNQFVMRDFLKFLEFIALRCSKNDMVREKSKEIIAAVIEELADDVDQPKFACITSNSITAVSDFFMHMTEKTLTSLRDTIQFAEEFIKKERKVADLLCTVIWKLNECSEIISDLLPLHTRFHIQKQRLVLILTAFFSTVEAPVNMMLHACKQYPKMANWEAVTDLARFLERRVQNIMATADENVGLTEEEARTPRKNTKQSQAKAKKDENIYVKYVKARETLQSLVLQLSKALKDDRLNLQIRNNTIGIRDFRIDKGVLKERITSAAEGEPAPKRRKKKSAPTQPQEEEIPQQEEAEEVYSEIF